MNVCTDTYRYDVNYPNKWVDYNTPFTFGVPSSDVALALPISPRLKSQFYTSSKSTNRTRWRKYLKDNFNRYRFYETADKGLEGKFCIFKGGLCLYQKYRQQYTDYTNSGAIIRVSYICNCLNPPIEIPRVLWDEQQYHPSLD